MTRTEALEVIHKIVIGGREKNYGTPEDNFATIADLWNVYLHRRGFNTSINSRDVAALMMLTKIARIAQTNEHIDSWVDTAGYAVCGASLIKDVEDA